MTPSLIAQNRAEGARALDAGAFAEQDAPHIVFSIDLEEHFRIEAASGLEFDVGLQSHYRYRLEACTHWLLEILAEHRVRATFFVVGKIAVEQPLLVKRIHAAGHEIASHGWNHVRIHRLTREAFRSDISRSKKALEDVTGEPVRGYRAPTFSVVRETSWAIDELVDCGFAYDSSIFPVWHDRYGVPGAPRTPFLARGEAASIVEIPPATLRLLGTNVPVGGGGYFRLLPLFMIRWAFAQIRRLRTAPVAMLYFHPWEFDPRQARLPLGRLNSFRTYVGLMRSRDRLEKLLRGHRFACAGQVASWLQARRPLLCEYSI